MHKRNEPSLPLEPLEQARAEGLPCDRWIASSALQKAIRRGQSTTAERAASTLSGNGWASVWRRLLVIAVEDVGVGSIDVCVEVARLAAGQARAKPAHKDAALSRACRLLAEAPKDRSTDYLIAAAMHDPGLEAARETCGCASASERLKFVADPIWGLSERSVAAWYASGVESWPERRVGRGDFDGLMRTYADLGVSVDLIEATRIATRITREPITVLLPLLSLTLANEPSEIVEVPSPPSGHVDEVPLYALDTHTRLGRRAISLFGRRTPEIANFLSEHFADFRAEKALRYAAFFADGGATRPRLSWRTGEVIERLGVAADFRSIGVDPATGDQLTTLVRHHLDQLNAIRAELLTRAAFDG